MTSSKIRIYDLARELKLESKRIIEEVRREGVDVNVASNTVSRDLADKIRNKYFPKKEVSSPRSVRVVKKAARPTASEEPETPEDFPSAPSIEETAPVIEPVRPRAETPASKPAAPVARLIKRLTPAARAAEPTSAPQESAAAGAPLATDAAELEAVSGMPHDEAPASSFISSLPQVEDTLASSPEAAPPSAAQTPEQSVAGPAGGVSRSVPGIRQIKALRPTTAALNAGIRHGDRAPAPAIAPPVVQAPTPRERREREEQRRTGRPQRGAGLEVAERGTPGETPTPQTTYIPPPDARRPRSRTGTRRGATGGSVSGRKGDARGGRSSERDFMPPPKALSLEARIVGSLNISSTTTDIKAARLVEGTTVKEFAEKLGIKPKDIVALLLQRGVFATMNQPLGDELAIELGQRFGYEVAFVPFEEMVAEEEFDELVATDADDVELPRAPVVTVMGHVDHGKTSLLDVIRTTEVAASEAGGITQHIGAYSVHVPSPDNPTEKRRIVFLDTPGHEAFTMMRARGAKATDIVVLVVAADDGVMPQTIEAIEHARAAHVPIIVAINKIDKPDANPDRVRQELAGHGLQAVEWGGETEMVAVSAKRHDNISALLETVLLTADILNLRASPTRLASGVVLEAKLDRGRGSVATVLVQQGTLRVGDPFIVGQIFGKVRAMFNDRGEQVAEVGPAMPVEVLGLQGVPQAGESFQVVADITRAQQISHHRQMMTRQNTLLQTTKRGIEALGEKEVKELLVILKADVQGSVEVLKSTLQKLSTERVKVKVIRSGVGAITESDVLLASATQASASNTAVVIIGFNVRPEVRAAELAKQEDVDVRLHSIIYKVEEEIHAAMLGMLDAVEKERIIGSANVRDVFRVPKFGAIAGCMVTSGLMRRNARARIIRDAVVAWEGGIASLRRFKDDVSEVREGFECGIGLENFNDIKVGDQIEAYVIDKVAATEL